MLPNGKNNYFMIKTPKQNFGENVIKRSPATIKWKNNFFQPLLCPGIKRLNFARFAD